MKILIPVDGRDYTKRALGYVAAHDELFAVDRERIFLHVVPELPTLAARQLTQAAADDFYKVESEAVFGPIRAFAQQRSWKFRLETARGHAATEIDALAGRGKAALIVMAAMAAARSRASRWARRAPAFLHVAGSRCFSSADRWSSP
jgi:nucleotide-binding universal stress UspA family protein